MKDGYIEKGYSPSHEDFEKIKQFTRKDIAEEELYVFSLTLCSNDIDRDFEKFSVQALGELAGLFIGKTGIRDHSMKSADQTARIFDTWVEKIPGRKTADGEDYYLLRAKAYMVRNDDNKSLITDIDAGIKKEVSVSCSMGSSVCSVCKKDMKSAQCSHIKGRKYGARLCYGILGDAADAYEWSFVAVPAQREAGVTKSFNTERSGQSMIQITKKLSSATGEITLSESEAREICSYIQEKEGLAELGEEYKKSLVKQLVSLCAREIPQMDLKVFEGVARVMTAKELLSFRDAFEKKQAAAKMPSPQLSKTGKKTEEGFNEFKI